MFNDFERAVSLMDRAQELNPNLAMAFHLSGWIRCFIGQPDLAIEHIERAVRLSPSDPQRPGMLAAIAAAHLAAGRFDIYGVSAPMLTYRLRVSGAHRIHVS